MLLHSLVTIPGHNASVICSSDRVTAKEADHVLASCGSCFSSFSSDQSHEILQTVSVTCCFDFSSSM